MAGEHHLSSLSRPCDAKSDCQDGFFYPTFTLMTDSVFYSLLHPLGGLTEAYKQAMQY